MERKKAHSYKLMDEVVTHLKEYKNHMGFHLGFYCQEYDIDKKGM